MSGTRTRRWALSALAGVLIAALLAGAIVQTLQRRLINQTVQIGDDYFVINFNQLESEYLRLLATWSAAADGAADLGALQLRYDIFVSRAELARDSFQRVERASSATDPKDVVAFITQADRLLGPKADHPPTTGELRTLLPDLELLGKSIHGLTLAVSHQAAARVNERNKAIVRANTLGIGLALVLLTSLAGLAFVVARQMRSLDQRRLELEALTVDLRQARQQAETAAATKSAFLANMSHEIRTPFQGLLGMLELLRGTPLSAQQAAMIGTAQDSGEHLLTILNDVLDLSKMEAGTLPVVPEPVALGPLVRQVESLMRAQAQPKGLAFDVRIDPAIDSAGSLMLDPTRVRQVLYNLLSNAIKFSDRGRVRLHASADAQALTFEVTDTGIGMDEATVAGLFQRFSQGDASAARRHGGTGLGLEISRRLARHMGGDITVRSRLGEGSTFTFRIPRVEAPVRPAAGAVQAATADVVSRAGRPLRVLVADDHAVNRAVFAALLERLGHHGVVVEDGEQALARAEAGPFDVVLLDLHMPRLDGAHTAARLRALGGAWATVPLVAVSADVVGESRDRAAAAGVGHFLPKPVSLPALQALLDRLGTPDAGLGAAAPPVSSVREARAVPVLGGGEAVDPYAWAHVGALLGPTGLGMAAAATRSHARELLGALAARRDAAPPGDRLVTARDLRADTDWAERAHALAGAAGHLGLCAIADAARTAEAALRAPAAPDWLAAHAALETAIERSAAWLRDGSTDAWEAPGTQASTHAPAATPSGFIPLGAVGR